MPPYQQESTVFECIATIPGLVGKSEELQRHFLGRVLDVFVDRYGSQALGPSYSICMRGGGICLESERNDKFKTSHDPELFRSLAAEVLVKHVYGSGVGTEDPAQIFDHFAKSSVSSAKLSEMFASFKLTCMRRESLLPLTSIYASRGVLENRNIDFFVDGDGAMIAMGDAGNVALNIFGDSPVKLEIESEEGETELSGVHNGKHFRVDSSGATITDTLAILGVKNMEARLRDVRGCTVQSFSQTGELIRVDDGRIVD